MGAEVFVAGFLVVEDDPPVARSTARLLKPYGDVHVAPTASDARCALRTKQFAGLIFDIVLPDGNGLDVLAEARKLGLVMQALVLTGCEDRAVLNRASTLNARLLLKPAENSLIEDYARTAVSRIDRLEYLLGMWQREYKLTVAELEALQLTAERYTQDQIAAIRGTSISQGSRFL